MRTQIVWEEEIPPPENKDLTNIIWAVCFSPDGTTVLIAVGDRVLIYDTETFELSKSLKGHGNSVYCLAFSKDGKRFASGGADKRVIVWASTGDGLRKYNHNTSIQCLSYNPVLQTLASGTGEDFGLWAPEQANVTKHKVTSKCLSMDWSPDGQILAIGLNDGTILLRDKVGEILGEIKKSASIWTLKFNPVKFDTTDNVLVVGCWDQTLSLWKVTNGNTYSSLGSDKVLTYDPLSMSFFSSGEYFVMSGSDKCLSLWTKDGVLIGTVGKHNDWIWCCDVKPKQQIIISGSNDGIIKGHHVIFSIVHGLYQDRYAHRELMTDVLIQHLVSETRVRIRCRDYVKKIAIYKDRLAVQLPEKIVIYSVSADDPYDMKYKAFKKISKKVDCSLLVVTSQNLLLCHERKLQLLNFSGDVQYEWNLESLIRYIKVIGGPSGREGLLVGLKNGEVLKIFVDNSFPIPLIKQSTPIRCLDISLDKKKLAVVDDHSNLFVYDIQSQELMFQEGKANSVAWNTEMEEMIAYTGNNILSIKTSDFAPISQRLQGFVVGFKSSKIFCLHYVAMNTIDVPQSATLYRFLERKLYDMAYKVACLGVTEQDWRALGVESLQAKNFEVARKSFVRLKDLKFIELVNKIEKESKNPSLNDSRFTAEIAAYQGKYSEAATIFMKTGLIDKAVDMYSQLKKWDEASTIAKKIEKMNKVGPKPGNAAPSNMSKDIIMGKADWAKENGDWKTAAEYYKLAGEFRKAIEILGPKGELDALYEICKSLDKKTGEDAILKCGKYFREHGNHAYAKEAYLRLGDIKSLMALHVELHKWNEAFMLAKQNPSLAHLIYTPYADFLSANDKYDEAQEAYKKAGRPDLALGIVECLTHNSVIEKRFKDAAHYFWILATENLKLVKAGGAPGTAFQVTSPHSVAPSQEDFRYLDKWDMYRDKADVYYAYHIVHKYIEEPFQNIMGGALYYNSVFNAASYLINKLSVNKDSSPLNINKVYVYYAIGKIGGQLEAFKTARLGFEKLQNLKIPTDWQNLIDIENLKIRTKPYSDKDGISPVCNRCMNTNAFVNNQGDICGYCGHPFLRSNISFDPIPLVEFQLPENMSHFQAQNLLKQDNPKESQKKRAKDDGWQETNYGNQQTLSLANPPLGEDMENDPFFQRTAEVSEMQVDPENYKPVPVDQELLLSMNYEEVFVEDYSNFCPSYPKKYYKNMVPEVPLTMCEKCSKIFLQDEYEFAYLENKSCPFCRFKDEPDLKEEEKE